TITVTPGGSSGTQF
nr:immunoglobulin light chain junction region [Macaca mulatta]